MAFFQRKHDHQYGWFDSVAKRHGRASHEVKQLHRALVCDWTQIALDLEPADLAENYESALSGA